MSCLEAISDGVFYSINHHLILAFGVGDTIARLEPGSSWKWIWPVFKLCPGVQYDLHLVSLLSVCSLVFILKGIDILYLEFEVTNNAGTSKFLLIPIVNYPFCMFL